MPERNVTVMRLDSEEQARFFQEELENAGIQAVTEHDPLNQPKQDQVLPLTGGPVVLMVRRKTCARLYPCCKSPWMRSETSKQADCRS
jgi:hypothetical protein